MGGGQTYSVVVAPSLGMPLAQTASSVSCKAYATQLAFHLPGMSLLISKSTALLLQSQESDLLTFRKKQSICKRNQCPLTGPLCFLSPLLNLQA